MCLGKIKTEAIQDVAARPPMLDEAIQNEAARLPMLDKAILDDGRAAVVFRQTSWIDLTFNFTFWKTDF